MLDGNLPRMSYSPSEIDANFYRLIHKMVAQDQEEETRERRGATRRPFRSMQRIAPCRGPGLPKEDEFFMARCYDLTRAGFSFLVPSRPDYEALVAALGDPPELIYVAAEVLHCRSVLLHRSGAVQQVDGQPGSASHGGQTAMPMVLVGCRFVERVEGPAEPS